VSTVNNQKNIQNSQFIFRIFENNNSEFNNTHNTPPPCRINILHTDTFIQQQAVVSIKSIIFLNLTVEEEFGDPIKNGILIYNVFVPFTC